MIRSHVRTSCAAAIALELCAPAAAFLDIEGIYRQQEEDRDVYRGFAFPPPEELLSGPELERYRQLYSSGNCLGAKVEIERAFIRRNPEAPDPIETMAWFSIVLPEHYPEVTFCDAMNRLGVAEAEIARLDLAPAPVRQHGRPDETCDNYDDEAYFPIFDRDSALRDLFRLAMNGYAPAEVALARLSAEGRAPRLTPAYAYFVLSRARAIGLDDPDLEPLFIAAEAALSAAERQRLKPRIAVGDWPRSEPVVLD